MAWQPGARAFTRGLFGKTRQALLGLFFTRVDEAFYVRELVRRTGVALGAVQRELRALTAAGVIRRTVRGRSVFYQANPDSPVFSELQGLMVRCSWWEMTVSLSDWLRNGWLHEHRTSREEIRDLLDVVERDLADSLTRTSRHRGLLA